MVKPKSVPKQNENEIDDGLKGKKSTLLLRAANAPVRATNAP